MMTIFSQRMKPKRSLSRCPHTHFHCTFLQRVVSLLGCEVLVVHEALRGKSTWWKRGPLEVRATLKTPSAPSKPCTPGSSALVSPFLADAEATEQQAQQQAQQGSQQAQQQEPCPTRHLLYDEPSFFFFAEQGENSCGVCDVSYFVVEHQIPLLLSGACLLPHVKIGQLKEGRDLEMELRKKSRRGD